MQDAEKITRSSLGKGERATDVNRGNGWGAISSPKADCNQSRKVEETGTRRP